MPGVSPLFVYRRTSFVVTIRLGTINNDAMAEENQKITVRPDGPYIVRSGIPLVRKKQVMSERGEPLHWQKESVLSTEGVYRLCTEWTE